MISEGGPIKPVEVCGCSNWEGEPPHTGIGESDGLRTRVTTSYRKLCAIG